MTDNENGYTPQERAALVANLLAHGRHLTTNQVAERLSMSNDGAYKLMAKLTRVLPIILDREGLGVRECGKWREI